MSDLAFQFFEIKGTEQNSTDEVDYLSQNTLASV